MGVEMGEAVPGNEAARRVVRLSGVGWGYPITATIEARMRRLKSGGDCKHGQMTFMRYRIHEPKLSVKKPPKGLCCV